MFSCVNVMKLPISVAARSRTCECGPSIFEIAGLNPSGGVDICLLQMLFVLQVEFRATGRSAIQGNPTECMCLSICVIS